MDLGGFFELVAAMRRDQLRLLDMISGLEWRESGYVHLWQFLMDAMRITRAEAKRLEQQVELVCPKVAITGQVIEPRLPVVRAAMAEGAISSDHVTRIAKTVAAVPDEHAEQVEADLTDLARQFHPTAVGRLGQRMVDALDPEALS